MQIFVRAVVTGFAFSLGAALFKKVSKQLGLEDAPPRTGEAVAGAEAPAT
ncbi:MAG: hypothetical protein IPL61_38120 [Myxococcales bacterium]|nr:hypothetical protein [Myxococcales bacterium]